MRLPLTAVLLLGFALPGCELVASFDRDKIPPPKLMRPDASFLPPMPGPDPLDAGANDAALADGAITDASLDSAVGDASSDAAVLDGSAADGSLDGDAQAGDASTPIDAATPLDGGLHDAAVRDL